MKSYAFLDCKASSNVSTRRLLISKNIPTTNKGIVTLASEEIQECKISMHSISSLPFGIKCRSWTIHQHIIWEME